MSILRHTRSFNLTIDSGFKIVIRGEPTVFATEDPRALWRVSIKVFMPDSDVNGNDWLFKEEYACQLQHASRIGIKRLEKWLKSDV
jgi:hypothetical protein